MYRNVKSVKMFKSVHMYKSVKMTNVFFCSFAVLQHLWETRKSFEHVVAANMFTQTTFSPPEILAT